MRGGYTMFTTPEQAVNPFATKIAEAVLEAGLEDKKPSSLKEEEPTSLLFPSDSGIWSEVAATFSVGQFKAECASTQFDDELPRIPDSLLQSEFAARSRLERTLSSFTLAEMVMLKLDEHDVLKVLVKSMLTSLKHDLSDFVLARRACRRHVFKQATVRHEPRKLIDGSIWGPNLFPTALVRATLDAASLSNQSLRERWGLSYKRRNQDQSSSQANPGKRGRGGSRGRGNYQGRGNFLRGYRIPKNPQPIHQQQPQQYALYQQHPTSSRAPPAQQVFVLQPQSPAFHAPFEQASSSQGFQQSRGRGGSQRRGGEGLHLSR